MSITAVTATAPSFRPSLVRRVVRRLRSLVYEPQVAMGLPTHVASAPPTLSAAYELRSATEGDHLAWVELLNADKGFGDWDTARLLTEIVAKLLTPGSAVMLFHQRQLVGCAAMCLAEFGGKPQPVGMYLILDAAHRGQFKLSNALYRATLKHAGDCGYDKTFATTLPDRMSALTLYLVNNAQPIHTSLWSHVQWRRIRRRLAPVVARMQRRS